MNNNKSTSHAKQIAAIIASQKLGISDLRAGGHGALVSLARIEEALVAAYRVGVAEGPDSGVSDCCGADIYQEKRHTEEWAGDKLIFDGSKNIDCCDYCRQPCGKLIDTVV